MTFHLDHYEGHSQENISFASYTNYYHDFTFLYEQDPRKYDVITPDLIIKNDNNIALKPIIRNHLLHFIKHPER